jgi:hypothetical protein
MLQQESVHDPTEIVTLRRMRWFLLAIILIWLLAAMVVTGLVIYLTKNLLSLSLFSTLLPPAYLLHWIAKRLFPMDEKTFELKKLSIQMKAWNNKDLHRSR